ncbi:hypothetical protein JHK85_000571 [Glycine max]|nr:hypothetical protein JHK85_000571 [Glycine max]
MRQSYSHFSKANSVAEHLAKQVLVRLPMNEELLWDNDIAFLEPCIDHIADTVGKGLSFFALLGLLAVWNDRASKTLHQRSLVHGEHCPRVMYQSSPEMSSMMHTNQSAQNHTVATMPISGKEPWKQQRGTTCELGDLSAVSSTVPCQVAARDA